MGNGASERTRVADSSFTTTACTLPTCLKRCVCIAYAVEGMRAMCADEIRWLNNSYRVVPEYNWFINECLRQKRNNSEIHWSSVKKNSSNAAFRTEDNILIQKNLTSFAQSNFDYDMRIWIFPIWKRAVTLIMLILLLIEEIWFLFYLYKLVNVALIKRCKHLIFLCYNLKKAVTFLCVNNISSSSLFWIEKTTYF